MKDFPTSLQRSQKAMLLSGFILSCLLQLAAAHQHSFSVIGEPRSPRWGQNVTLSLRGGPSSFVQCQWVRDNSQEQAESGTILTYSPEKRPSSTQGKAYSGRERVERDCSLHIRSLRKSDVGKYSVTINTGSTQQQGDTQIQEKTYQSSFYLQLSESGQVSIKVEPRPKYPSLGQSVTLVPQGFPREFHFCEWFRQTRFGTEERIHTYIPGETQSQQQKREKVQQDCSLTITQLTAADTGNYTIMAEAPSQPGKGTEQQGTDELNQFYVGHVYLEVNQQSEKNSHSAFNSGPNSLTYSAWIVAGAFLASFAWAESLTALFSIFFSSSVDKRLTIN
ncbi:uncharacterized protein LOC121915006 [Sceloporus undulatus]|uniref:uncharacterized protein LOC121915006 n=1 Tax=Sceloporus undulatus TaxID=8520 RepID=UPI001C4A850F|nr:uncharacterized protein LOC121915006 [Sceloporus undulatus]